MMVSYAEWDERLAPAQWGSIGAHPFSRLREKVPTPGFDISGRRWN
jgi:hypothetical protein